MSFGQTSSIKIGCIANDREVLNRILRVSVPKGVKIVVQDSPPTAAAGLNKLLDNGCNVLVHQGCFVFSRVF